MNATVLTANSARPPLSATSQKSSGFFGQAVLAIGVAVGAIASLGAVAGFLLAALVEVSHPEQEVKYGEWISYSGALSGLLALLAELVYRLN